MNKATTLLSFFLTLILFQTLGCVHGSGSDQMILKDGEIAAYTSDQIKRGVKSVPSVLYSIQEADGYADLSEERTDLEARFAAIENAKKIALESAKAYIKAETGTDEFVIKPDPEITVKKDYGKEKDNRYHVRISARVEYELNLSPVTVNVWTSKKIYKQGENIVIHIRGDQDYYAQVFDFKPNGEKVRLLPYGARQLGFLFKAGKIYKIPDQKDDFELKAVPPYGKNQVVVYASVIPFKEQIREVRRLDRVPIGCNVKIWEFTVEK